MKRIKEKLNKGFLIIPVEIVTKTTVKGRPFSLIEKSLYSYLLCWKKNKGLVFPSTRRICTDLGIGSRASLAKYLNKLEEKDLIVTTREKGKANKYTLLDLKDELSKPVKVSSMVSGTNADPNRKPSSPQNTNYDIIEEDRSLF